MDAQFGIKEDIDLSHDDNFIDNSKNPDKMNENVSSETTHITEMTEDEHNQQDKGLNGEESIKLRKKSVGRSDSPDKLLDKDEYHGGEGDNSLSTQFGKKQDFKENEKEKVEEKQTEVAAKKNNLKGTFQQIAIFLILFCVFVIVNQAAMRLILYFFKPDDTSVVDDVKGLEDVDSSKYEKEHEFSEFDRLMEH